MADVNLSDYKILYLKTARKYIGDLNTALTALASDKTNKEIIETIYISSHSLKSQSQIMTYIQTGVLSGTIEALFRSVREGKQEITDDMINQLKEAAAQISASLDSIEKENKELELTQSIDAMKRFTGGA